LARRSSDLVKSPVLPVTLKNTDGCGRKVVRLESSEVESDHRLVDMVGSLPDVALLRCRASGILLPVLRVGANDNS
jgi:hypothetical protein